jgi:tetratricopeptide (TPR) repeat protein
LNAYILVSRFSSGEFDIENEYEVLFDSFTKEINKNLGIIELFEARAWLCYDILDYFPDLDKSKYLFYKTQSESDFSFCISLKPNNIEYYRSRALLFRDTKDFSKALQDINKAIDLSPRYSRNYKDRADILKSMGKLKDSLNDIQTAISLCEDNRWLREYQKIASQIIAMMEPLNKKCF